MLALWQGITAVPWEGPPPVDMGGFMSIVLGAATGRDVGGADAPFGNRNYFMISKYFCNLTSRLGYHFSTVEALCGESLLENYVRFDFKGGAADQARRVSGHRFVGKILERFDFKVDMKDDSLFARLEGESLDFMLAASHPGLRHHPHPAAGHDHDERGGRPLLYGEDQPRPRDDGAAHRAPESLSPANNSVLKKDVWERRAGTEVPRPSPANPAFQGRRGLTGARD